MTYDPLFPTYDTALTVTRWAWWLVFFALVLAILYATGALVLLEDGSFIITLGGYHLSGCLSATCFGG